MVLCIAFLVFLAWSIGVSYWLGYRVQPEETLDTVLGMPSWVFWGIAVPWLTADVFTIGFCMFYMRDDDLGEVQNEDPR